MIKFIEEKTTKDNKIIGIPYNTDPYTDSNGDERNYRFYFDDNQSINIIYQKRLFFISDNEKVSIEILDTPPTKNTVFFLFDYIDAPTKLEGIKKTKVESTGISIGDNKFLHYVNIGSCSDSEGEFIENIKFIFVYFKSAIRIFCNYRGLNLSNYIFKFVLHKIRRKNSLKVL